jgi:hypothetical protein
MPIPCNRCCQMGSTWLCHGPNNIIATIGIKIPRYWHDWPSCHPKHIVWGMPHV